MDGADLMAGVHLLSALETGHVSSAPGAVMAAADLFTLEIFGRGGHGANPHETVDPVAVAAQVITNLQQIVSRETDPFDSVVVSVTTLDAGTARNMIPGSARIGGTVRTLSPPRREEVRDAMERVIAGVTSAHRADYRFDFEVGYDPVVNDGDVPQPRCSAALWPSWGRRRSSRFPPSWAARTSPPTAPSHRRLLLGRDGERGARDDVPAPPPAVRHRRGGPARRHRRLRPDGARRARVGRGRQGHARDRGGGARRDRVHRARVRARSQGCFLRPRGCRQARRSIRPACSRRSSRMSTAPLAVAVVPVAAQLDLQGARQAATMADPKLAERTTGLCRRQDQPARPAQAAADAARRVGARASRRSSSAPAVAASRSSSPRAISSR